LFKHIQHELNSHIDIVEKVSQTLQSYMHTASVIIHEAIKKESNIYIFGNGTNSITAQYIASYFGESISSDVDILTKLANSYGLDKIYEKQVESRAKSGDVLIGISTSGNSKNVLRALSFGRNMGCKTIGLSGYDGGALSEFCDINIVVPSDDAHKIHEIHMIIASIVYKTF